MSDSTKIQWTDKTFNPWSGCSKVHTGCAHCYAEVNYSVKMRGVKWGPNGTRVKTANWNDPVKWNRAAEKAGTRARVFCASLADVFEDWQGPIHDHKGEQLWHSGGPGYEAAKASYYSAVTMDDLRRDLFKLIDATPWLDWQLLTKRPENVRRLWPYVPHTVLQEPQHQFSGFRKNVWIGTSVSDQETADKAIPELLKCRDLAPVLFVSAEPLVGNVYLEEYLWSELGGRSSYIDWVIVGGESGHHARQCNIADVQSLVRQCREAGVACFVKQLGENTWGLNPESDETVNPVQWRFVDSKGGDINEWPEYLKVREFPMLKEAGVEI